MFNRRPDDLHRQVQRFIEYVNHRPSHIGAITPDAWEPNVDVYETPEEVVVLVELPGVQSEAVDLAVQGQTLRVAGTRSPQFRPGPRRFSYLEVPYGRFERTVHLPAPVESEKAEAHFANGMLEIVMPVVQPVRPRIQTTIQQGEQQPL